MSVNIAIDGPAGAGKSTIAKKVAKSLGYIYVDTGAMYRAMAYFLMKKNVDATNQDEISRVCTQADIAITYQDGNQVVICNNENVTPYLRTQEVGEMASKSSANPKLREQLVALQKKLAASTDVVMDGRDIGTVVLPMAQVKIFLTASVEVRAKRRFDELTAKGETCDFDQISAEIAERDERDMTRAVSPLKQADDAILIDSSDLSIDEVTEKILAICEEKKYRTTTAQGRTLILAKSAGFCFGVERAVDCVYNEVASGNQIYTYGPIIHNEEVVKDLEQKGVKVLEDTSDLDGKDGTIVIRSHGVSQKVFDKIEESGLRVEDATCPFVKRIHNTVSKASEEGAHIVIIGNVGHPEVEGIMGWSKTPATVIETAEEMKQFEINPSIPVCVVAQTTFNIIKFKDLVDILVQKGYNINVVNTICNATNERQTEAKEISAHADVMIVIGGRTSSNSAKLFEICKKECEHTFFIQTWEDLHLNLTQKEQVIGITAGASTPKNIIEEVQNHVRTDF